MMAISVACCAALACLWPKRCRALALEVLFLLISLGLGTILPLSTITIQNAVPHHQLGTATASMNFFRSLGGALIVAAFGTILLGGTGATAGSDMQQLIGGGDTARLAQTFRAVFAAADVGLLLAWFWLAMLEERPLVDRRKTQDEGLEGQLPHPVMD